MKRSAIDPLPPMPSRLPRASLHPYAMPVVRPQVPRPANSVSVMRSLQQPRPQPQQPCCEVCRAPVSELRRGRCWGCYSKWVEARPVGLGAKCITCGEQRRRVLKNVELYGNWKPMCFNCAGQLLHLDPLPQTIAALRAAVSRERRGNDRRVGKPDTRVFKYERRVGDRRVGRVDAAAIKHDDDNDLEIEIVVEPVAANDGMDFDDLTQIRELVRELRPE